MNRCVDEFTSIHNTIKKHRRYSSELIALCEQGMELLPDVLPHFTEQPRSIFCRETLIQAYAARDCFPQARDVVKRADQAGAYLPNRKAAVLARIDAMEQAKEALHACIRSHPGLLENEAAAALQKECDETALRWYTANSHTLRKLPESSGYSLWFPASVPEERQIKAAVLDVETTGMSRARDEIVEIGVMLCRVDQQNGEITGILEEVDQLHEPSFPIPPAVSRIHGIRDKDVAGRQIDFPRLERLFHETDVVIAHNASFDRSFVQRYFPAAAAMKWRCSVQGISWKRYGFPTRKLLDLCRRHQLTQHQSHRALDDVKLTVQLLQQQSPAGEYYMKELLEQ
ncbi:exonuclease domain-containing protein [Salibacterium aidingense]|uniref:exonuclease domain-containing protein n=1 Tax=Salibacterium aidingense TaxID=384933 RepID=UPI003BCD9AA7